MTKNAALIEHLEHLRATHKRLIDDGHQVVDRAVVIVDLGTILHLAEVSGTLDKGTDDFLAEALSNLEENLVEIRRSIEAINRKAQFEGVSPHSLLYPSGQHMLSPLLVTQAQLTMAIADIRSKGSL